MRTLGRHLLAALAAMSIGVGANAQVGTNMGLLNPNLASSEELAAVPGLASAAVEAIVDGRPVLRMANLHAVVSAHVDDDALNGIYRALWLPIDLNDVTDKEVLLIPGVGERMLHEFEEYRPYTALAEFHREIGKYVDEDEVARLERYVEIR